VSSADNVDGPHPTLDPIWPRVLFVDLDGLHYQVWGHKVCMVGSESHVCMCWQGAARCVRVGSETQGVYVLAGSRKVCTCWQGAARCVRVGSETQGAYVLPVRRNKCTCQQ
jgi:hypothetical protein